MPVHPRRSPSTSNVVVAVPGLALPSSLLIASSLLIVSSLLAADAVAPVALVPEMEDPAGILAQPRSQVRGVEDHPHGRRGLERLAARVAALWPQIRAVDFVELSRFHVEETRGWRPPAVPGKLTGRVIGRDEASGHWYLEVRGPRLPARYDIVHRYLWVFARFDPTTEELDRVTVTIRGWVLE